MKIEAEEFDRKFDKGEDMTEYVDWSKAKRPNQNIRRISVDMPMWMVNQLDGEARRLNVTRQSVIKYLVSEKFSTE